MKQMKYYLLTLLCLMVSSVAFADDKPIPVDQLPAAAKTFVGKHFKAQKIAFAEKDRDSYECHLDNGAELEFTKKGDWKKVDCKRGAVPAALVPQAIQDYVKANYANCQITKIEKERYGFEIELSNDLDLKFDKKGKLLGMDD